MTPSAETLGAAFVLALLAGLAVWLKRARPGERRLTVLETAPLGQGCAVAVVRAGGKCMLVGITGQSIAPLAELDAREWPEGAAIPQPLRASESEAP